ncbi:MAG: hypothetical protein WBF90_33850 [Rivularia sp. (in: cyanobacteria)]
MSKKVGRPRSAGRLVHFKIKLTPSQEAWVKSHENQSELVRKLIEEKMISMELNQSIIKQANEAAKKLEIGGIDFEYDHQPTTKTEINFNPWEFIEKISTGKGKFRFIPRDKSNIINLGSEDVGYSRVTHYVVNCKTPFCIAEFYTGGLVSFYFKQIETVPKYLMAQLVK